MTITIEVDGDVYTGFVGASVTQSLSDVCNSFSFSASAADGVPLPFKGQEACRIYVDGALKLTGAIELINVDGDGKKHNITLSGRGKCGDLLDSMLGPMEDLQGTLSLKSICEKVIAQLGLDIEVIDHVRPKTFEAMVDMGSPDAGEFAIDFLEPLARKRQVLLSENANGDLIITRARSVLSQSEAELDSIGLLTPIAGDDQGGAVGAYIHHRVDDPELKNNVLEYAFSRDFTGRYNIYRTVGSMSVVAASLEEEQLAVLGLSAQFMSSQLALTRDKAIRKGRQHVLVDESAIPKGDTAERSRWERDIRRARGDVYGVTVDGFKHAGGEHWFPNTFVTVLSEYAGINDKMMVDTVTFDQSPDARTTLSLIDKDAYSLSLAEPVEEDFGVFG